MSKNYNYEIGYETLRNEWEIQKKRTPRGVTLAKGGNNIYLQFKTPNTTRSKYKCACTFSIDGMHEAVRKSYLVKSKLKTLSSETEFWEWYKKEIEEENGLVDDKITFTEAIAKVENDFWSRPSRTKRKRDKDNPSDQSSWRRTYGCFYKHLAKDKTVNISDILKVIDQQKRGTRNYKYVVSAMKKLARVIKRNDILKELEDINITQTENAELQTVTFEEFWRWKNEILNSIELNAQISDTKNRRAWLWVFSMQVVYGLRISEVFAIKNLTKPYVTKDGVSIPALSDSRNTENSVDHKVTK